MLIVVAIDTYEYEYRYKNMLSSTDEIFKCKKHNTCRQRWLYYNDIQDDHTTQHAYNIT